MFWDLIFKIFYKRKIEKITNQDPKFNKIKGYARELSKIKKEREELSKEMEKISEKLDEIDKIENSPEYSKSLKSCSPEVRKLLKQIQRQSFHKSK